MSVVEHELKRHDVWREELHKKTKAYILLMCCQLSLALSWSLCLTDVVWRVFFNTLVHVSQHQRMDLYGETKAKL